MKNNKPSSSFAQFFTASSKLTGVKFAEKRLHVALECLQKAASLCSQVELHDHCGEMLEPLTSLICPEINKGSFEKSGSIKYTLNNLLYIEEILKNATELASQSPDCWKYVMR